MLQHVQGCKKADICRLDRFRCSMMFPPLLCLIERLIEINRREMKNKQKRDGFSMFFLYVSLIVSMS